MLVLVTEKFNTLHPEISSGEEDFSEFSLGFAFVNY